MSQQINIPVPPHVAQKSSLLLALSGTAGGSVTGTKPTVVCFFGEVIFRRLICGLVPFSSSKLLLRFDFGVAGILRVKPEGDEVMLGLVASLGFLPLFLPFKGVLSSDSSRSFSSLGVSS